MWGYKYATDYIRDSCGLKVSSKNEADLWTRFLAAVVSKPEVKNKWGELFQLASIALVRVIINKTGWRGCAFKQKRDQQCSATQPTGGSITIKIHFSEYIKLSHKNQHHEGRLKKKINYPKGGKLKKAKRRKATAPSNFNHFKLPDVAIT